MSIAVLPFSVMERSIVDKEIRNSYYKPIFYQLAQGVSLIPGTAILAFVTSIILVPMVHLSDPGWYFLNMFLCLAVAESLAQFISILVPHYVIGMALVSGIYGFFMTAAGFMLVPSQFPDWLRWTHFISFHTYSFRTFMYTEFIGIDHLTDVTFGNGYNVLRFYDIEETNRQTDVIILATYTVALQLASCIVLHLRHTVFYSKLEYISRKNAIRSCDHRNKKVCSDEYEPQEQIVDEATSTKMDV
eukprot:scaffold4976_cov161-Amphora_coffeaeformis.AAC.23